MLPLSKNNEQSMIAHFDMWLSPRDMPHDFKNVSQNFTIIRSARYILLRNIRYDINP